jgi:beta-xylosidase
LIKSVEELRVVCEKTIRMRYILLALSGMILFTGCSRQMSYSGNPAFPGWYADPEGIVYGREYWIFPTYSAPYKDQVFMDAFSSRDLTNWKKHERIIDTSAIKWAEKAMWAPSVISRNGNYFLLFGANDIQSNDQYGGIGVAIADKPEGPYRDYLGKPLIDKFHNGAQPIDQFVFEDRDGQLYLIYGGWRHCNIVMLKDDLSGIVPMPDGALYKEITPEGYVEGPFMFIRDGKYYFMWSEGGWTGPDYSVAYAISDNPFGPWKRIGKILQQDPEIGTGAGHHSVINVPGTDKYYIIYHRRPLGQKDRNARETCIDKMEFDENGLIKQVRLTKEGVPAQRIKRAGM